MSNPTSSHLTISVEFLAGTEFTKAVSEAKQLAERLQLAYVAFSFNGVKCSIGANADVEEAYKQFREAFSKKDLPRLVTIA